MPRKAMKKEKKGAAFVIAVIAIVILAINALISMFTSDAIIQSAQQDESFSTFLQDYNLSGAEIQSAVIFFGIMWIIFAVVMMISLINIKKQPWKYAFLAVGILTLITMRWVSGVLAIISAVMYLRKK